VNLDVIATGVRILAHSSLNWIGVYEASFNSAPPLSGLVAHSNVGELTTGASFGPGANLFDANPNTLAYPGNVSVDYTIDPGQRAYIDEVKVTWGYFGTSPLYVNSWRVLGLALDGRTWDVIARGGYPAATETLIPVNNRYAKFRIAADGANWLGIADLQVFGSTLPVPNGQYTVKSLVTEDPVYSIARGHQAAALIDGDTRTLAYPGGPHIDYELSFAEITQLSSASINWGSFGTNPIYINSWSLLARSGPNQPWVTIAQGGFPNSATTVLNLDFAATDVRIVADSVNWIGIYELQLKGVPLP
jgi:hypothetical protein